MPKRKLTPLAKILIVVLFIVLAFFGLRWADKAGLLSKIAPGEKSGSGSFDGLKDLMSSSKEDDVIDIGVVTWGGYAAGQYYNNGFEASKESRFYKDYQILVKFHVIDDFQASRSAWKAGKLDLLWTTVDAFPTEVEALSEFEPKIVFQADWSRGGDAIVVGPKINSANDLIGKKIAVAFGTPSHTFILYVLDAGNLSLTDVELVEVPNAIDAAAAFKAGRVDAAVVWSPDDEDCVKSVSGAKVLLSTKQVKYIIADAFFAKKKYIENHKKELQSLVEGWMKGAAELNSSDAKRREAAKILSKGFGPDINEDFCYNAIQNVRLCTYGDNRRFFGLSPHNGMTGEKLYTKMAKVYTSLRMAKQPTAWNDIIDTSTLESLRHLSDDPGNSAEGKETYTKAKSAEKNASALTTKQITINFPSGSATLEENAKQIIDLKFGDIMLMSANRIRIEGNTDDTGSRERNMELSKERAKSVMDYLVKKYEIDRNRFIVIGNGPEKPVADNSTEEGRAKNRRTDFILLEE
ncbi:MAG: OmpA family protein [Leptospiraceae bacterium]|nr:OmpA family protein [Leptospiraceae bacterium]MCP5496516.1 OmpA family protein [Leptospiraceae bacterium]